MKEKESLSKITVLNDAHLGASLLYDSFAYNIYKYYHNLNHFGLSFMPGLWEGNIWNMP